MWGLGLELPGLGRGLGFYDKVSVSSRNLSQVSVSVLEVTVSTTSLKIINLAVISFFSRILKTVRQVKEVTYSWPKYLFEQLLEIITYTFFIKKLFTFFLTLYIGQHKDNQTQ